MLGSLFQTEVSLTEESLIHSAVTFFHVSDETYANKESIAAVIWKILSGA
jgi:hypothetical protein